MSLKPYFENLLKQLAESEIDNAGKDANGFFEPTREMLFQKLSMLRDLHANPNAKAMVKDAWNYVTQHVPPDWLILTPEEKGAIRKMLAD